MKVIEKHDLTETILVEVLGWKWMSFVGVPTKFTKCYPATCRVRQLLSPKAMKSKRWKQYLEEHAGREATGDEPLAYCYCSMSGPEVQPRIILLIDER